MPGSCRTCRFRAMKVIHSNKKLFCKVMQNCNLVQEFNGLVSKRVNQKIGPFYFNKTASFFFV